MEADKTLLWFDVQKVAKTHTRYATVTGDQSLAAIVQQSTTDADLVMSVGALLSTKNIKAALHLREFILLCMGSNVNEAHVRLIETAFVDHCSKEPSALVEIYSEVQEEFKLVRIDFANSYCRLIKCILERYPGILEHPCFSEVQLTESVLLKKISEIESHYARVVEQDRQCRSNDVIWCK